MNKQQLVEQLADALLDEIRSCVDNDFEVSDQSVEILVECKSYLSEKFSQVLDQVLNSAYENK